MNSSGTSAIEVQSLDLAEPSGVFHTSPSLPTFDPTLSTKLKSFAAATTTT